MENVDNTGHDVVKEIAHVTHAAERMDLTEELKASDPMRWVQMMNSIKASAEEFVLKEVVYK